MFSLMAFQFFAVGLGIAVTVPLAIHMIQSSQTVKMPFSTIRFLKMAEKKSSRQVKLENMILWLLRTALMFLLSLAFGLPVVRTTNFGNLIGRTQRDVAIIIDSSYSMQYIAGKDSVWSKTLETATEIVNGLTPGDRVCLYLADEDVVPVVEQLSEELEFVKEQIKALKTGFTSSQLAPAILAANSALVAEKRNREREIHIITDNQALPWSSFGKGNITMVPDAGKEEEKKPEVKKEEESARKKKGKNKGKEEVEESASITGWDPKKVGDKTTVFVTLLGAATPENVTPADVDVQPRLIMEDMPSKLTVSLAHCGAPRDSSVTVFLDGVELQTRSTIVGGAGGEDMVFSLPPLKTGDHTARVELPEDNLIIDNEFHFLFKVKESLPTLVVGDAKDSLFLVKALTVGTGGKSGIRADIASPDDISSQKLSEYSCVFLCNALPLDGQRVVDLEQYVQGGALLVIFPGDKASASDYDAWRCLPAKPKAITELSLAQRKHMLRWEKPQHPLLRELKIGQGGAPIMTIRNCLIFGALQEDSEILVSAGAEKGFILDRAFGLGHVLLFNVSCDRTWSSFPLSPYFLPFMHQVVQYGAGMGGFIPYVWATESLSLREYLPEATRDTVILDPDGKEVSIRSSVQDGRTLFYAENVTQPGIYTMRSNSNPTPTPALAVNISRNESDLTPVDQSRIGEITELNKIYVANSKDDLLKKIADHRLGKSLGETCLWLALIIAVIEFFYANYKSKTKPKLTEHLGIDVTGAVKG